MTDSAQQPHDPSELRTPRAGDVVTVVLHGWAHGGEAVGRMPDGMACFVGYALPGETVTARITQRKKRWARADLVEVIESSPHRVSPPCPHFGPNRCGGCQLQHAAPAHQLELKARVLSEQLSRLGGVANPPVTGVQPVGRDWPAGYRSWARMTADDDGALGFRTAGSHTVHAVDHCLLMTDGADQLRQDLGDDWPGIKDLTLMAGSDGAVVTVNPGDHGIPAAPAGQFGLAIQGPGSPAVVRGPAAVVMSVGGVSLQVSAGSFFQAGPAVALALATVVVDAAAVQPGDHVLDLYAGVGLFSAFLAADDVTVTAVESNAAAVADARQNLAGRRVDILGIGVEAALAEIDAADVIVLDPPRSGAGKAVAKAMARLRPRVLVYVACDPAALARDTRILCANGMTLRSVHGIDAFGHTAQVEAVAVFGPADQDGDVETMDGTR